MTTSLERQLAILRATTEERLGRFPGSPFFTFGLREIERIESRVAAGPPIDPAFYDSLNIGVMCARELESVDMPYCDQVYAMLEEVRIIAMQG